MTNITVNEGTAKGIATDLVGTLHYGIVKVDMGTAGVSNPFTGTLPTVSNLAAGTITKVEGGTIQSNILTGTVTRVSTIGTLELGTVTVTNPTGTTVTVDHGTVTLSNPTGTTVQFNNGTIDLVKAGTITRLEGGTVQSNILTGTVTSVTEVANLAKGTITRVEGGTIGRVSTVGTVEVGTITAMPNIPGGTLGLVTTVSNLSNGSIKVTNGTIDTMPAVYAEDSAHTTGNNGLFIMAVRNDGGTSLVGTDLDYAPLSLDVNGNLRTTATLEGGGTTITVDHGSIVVTAGTITNLLRDEDTGHTTGDKGVMILGVRNDAGTSLVGTDLDYAPLSFDADGNLRTTATLNGGTTVTVDHGTITVSNPTGTTVQFNNGTVDLIKAGTITTLPNIPGGTLALVTTVSNLSAGSVAVTAGTITNLLKVEDAGHSTGDSGVMNLAVRVDGGTSLVGTDLDYAPLQVDANGALRVTGTVASSGTTVQFNNGTIDLVKAGTITRLEGGTVQTNILTGTVTSLSNLAAGTVTKLEQGSINVTAGTITAGTLTRLGNLGTIESGTILLNPKPNRNIFNFGTVNAGTIGTLVAAPGAGTSIWINDISVECYGGTVEALVSWGLTTSGGGAAGGGPIIRGNFTTGGGQQKTPAYPFNGGTTNVALTYNILSGSGTVSYLVSYWVE